MFINTFVMSADVTDRGAVRVLDFGFNNSLKLYISFRGTGVLTAWRSTRAVRAGWGHQWPPITQLAKSN